MQYRYWGFALPFLFLLFVLNPSSMLAQESASLLRGKVFDAKTRAAQEGVSCQVLDADGRPLSFVSSKADGSFELKRSEKATRLVLRLLGYRKESVAIGQLKQPLHFYLEAEETQLQEVLVRVRPVRKYGDTISYNAASFASREDRYLADLLQKLPGIEVKSNGSILYQGEPISNMYIEGVDMLEQRYNLASKNLPSEAVGAVQVLENHQQVKALKDDVPESRAALNIKLKGSYKQRPFGELMTAVGLSKLWSGKLFAMQIGGQLQSMLTLNTNNTGRSLEDETRSLSAMQSPSLGTSKMLSHAERRALPMQANRYLMNRSLSAAYNGVLPLKKDLILRSNVSLLGERIEQERLSLSQLNVNSPAEILLSEKEKLQKRVQAAEASLGLESNTESRFLKNVFKLLIQRDKGRTDLDTKLNLFQQEDESLPRQLQNDLKLIFNRGEQIYEINSLLSYQDCKESIDLHEILTDKMEMQPRLLQRKLSFANSLTTTFRLGALHLKSMTQANYYKQVRDYRSRIEMPLIAGLPGLFKSEHEQTDLLERLSIDWKRGRFSHHLSLPLSWQLFALDNEGAVERRRSSRFAVSPLLSSQWTPNSDWLLKAVLNHSKFYGGYSNFQRGYLRQSYRSYLLPTDFMSVNYQSMASLKLDYRDVLHMFYLSLGGSYSIGRTNMLMNYEYTPEASYLRPEKHWHNSEVLMTNMRLSKFFFELKTNATLELSYLRTKALFKQSGILLEGYSNRANLKATLYKNFAQLLSLKYDFNTALSWMDEGSNAGLLYPQYKHLLSVNLTPTAALTMNLNAEYVSTKLDRKNTHEDFFLDASLGYRCSKSLEFGLYLNNLFDRRSYLSKQYTEFNIYTLEVPIRGRELLLNMRYRY